jgi:hypothetical protein
VPAACAAATRLEPTSKRVCDSMMTSWQAVARPF